MAPIASGRRGLMLTSGTTTSLILLFVFVSSGFIPIHKLGIIVSLGRVEAMRCEVRHRHSEMHLKALNRVRFLQ